ncbi:inter-alpha-trypsin inhibitor [Myripristis murdjan]|uniref:inter-alpha-trypsin inhibitor n=1 Tax=Myripristis murdjan TaxID=586833 RepID=UPI001176180D|nr:inter-alpha-trypsin inhibitor-like [Myripristis murdjan]
MSFEEGVTAFCNLPHDEGQGTGFIFASYYDPDTDLCYPFIYKGEGGNENRFTHERECIRNCSTRAEEIYPIDETQACHFPHTKGQCSGQYLRYYYDSVHDKCKKFLYTGCVGNGNRFFDQVSCNATCDGIHDDREAEEEDEPDTPVALICGVVFGVVGAIIIIVVIALTIQSS